MHKRIKDAFDDAPHAKAAYLSTELRIPEHPELVENPQACSTAACQ